MTKREIEILRELARRKMEIAADPQNEINKKLWTDTNDLKMSIPPIYINEVCWNEMNVNDELTLQTDDPFCRELEDQMRKEIYSWNHFAGNMVVSPYMECPIVVTGDNFGISEDVDIIQTDATSDVVSRHFRVQIKDEQDICKIKEPKVEVDREKTDQNFSRMQEIFDGIFPVKLTGRRGMWFTPWDNLIRWTGVEPVMYDLIERPEYIDALVSRFVDVSISLMEQYRKLKLWASNNLNQRVGSGGYGYTTALDAPDGLDTGADTRQLWGCGNAQIFSDVSEQMHWEFSLKHEIRWLKQFGLNYYGCCEPLHNKMRILEKIPNLRKVSVSPWCNIEVLRENAKGNYVLSCKPSPAVFATDTFDEQAARRAVRTILEQTRGCSLELIMKDISTVRYQPQKLWRWSEIAREEIDRMYR